MNFLWPISLIVLGALPLVVAFYFWQQRRRRRFTLRYSSLALVREALPAQSQLRRYLPMALFILALASLVFGLARPITVTTVPAGRATVVLALDISRSMLQADILPSRLAAAKEAALAFVERQEATNQIGIVAFAGFAQLVQPPTTDTEALGLAIQSLTTGRGTAIGNGILAAIDTIAEYNQNVAPITQKSTTPSAVEPLPEGEYQPDIIVVLTDGVTTTGPDPVFMAMLAAERGVRVYTIGYGTKAGATDSNSNFFGGWGWRRGIDEETLMMIADITGGEYYAATSANELQKVFASLPTYLITREETIEISFLFAGIGALLAIAAVLLAQLWHPLP
jgi:Ca-activated chloride channel homolog